SWPTPRSRGASTRPRWTRRSTRGATSRMWTRSSPACSGRRPPPQRRLDSSLLPPQGPATIEARRRSAPMPTASHTERRLPRGARIAATLPAAALLGLWGCAPYEGAGYGYDYGYGYGPGVYESGVAVAGPPVVVGGAYPYGGSYYAGGGYAVDPW